MRFEGTSGYVATDDLKIAVNAAITLERPLLVKGEPGTGKTVLALEVAKAIGAPETIAATPDEVGTIAVRLAQNPDLRREIVARMAANKHRLYFDRAPVAALEDLLEKSLRG